MENEPQAPAKTVPESDTPSDLYPKVYPALVKIYRARVFEFCKYARKIERNPHCEVRRLPPADGETAARHEIDYDTDVNRYARLLLARNARLMELLFPEEDLAAPIRALLSDPFFSKISPDRTPRKRPINSAHTHAYYRLRAMDLEFSGFLAALVAPHTLDGRKEEARQISEERRRAARLPLDVLVGTVRSPEQFQRNLAGNFYYVPASQFPAEAKNARYVALYQSQNLFGGGACIRFYGEIASVAQVLRREIPVPASPQKAMEPYYLLRVHR